VKDSELLAPFTTLMDLALGTLEPEGEVVDRRVVDLHALLSDDPGGDGPADDILVYRVRSIPVPETISNIRCSTTVVYPGRIGREYFMTKGHFHQTRDRAEIYIGLAGEGRLVLASEEGRHAVEPIRRGTVGYVPGGWAHRSVNVGDSPLVFFAAYVGDAGHDYAAIERTGFPVLVLAGANGPEIVENPRYRR
jgi:glucose-6-phosphate isomerase, archaeal